MTGWSGLFAPAGTPPAIINRIANVLRPALHSPEMRKRMETVGAEPGGNSPADFAKQVAGDARKWSEFVRTSGIKVTQ